MPPTKGVEWATFVVLTITMIVLGWYAWEVHEQTGLITSQIGATKAATELDERAWLSMESVVGSFPGAWQALSATVKWRNTGKTPALHIRSRAGLWRFERGTKPQIQKADVTLIGPPSFAFLSPNQQISTNAQFVSQYGVPIILRDDQFERLKKGDDIYYAFGRVEYDDIFRRHHWLTYCMAYRAEINSFDACESGNDTDGD